MSWDEDIMNGVPRRESEDGGLSTSGHPRHATERVNIADM
jgi:hypothetical protein